MKSITQFAYLQLLDVLTTLVGIRLGCHEASPVVAGLMGHGPVVGLVGSKLLAAAIYGTCVRLNRPRAIYIITIWYAGLVVWNLAMILMFGKQHA